MEHAQALRSLAKVVDSLHSRLGELLSCLAEEAQQLANPRSPELQSVIDRKQSALQDVDTLESARQDILRQIELDPHASMFTTILTSLGNKPLLTSWESILSLLEQCQAQNLTNGSLLALRQRFATQALSVLRGSAETQTYQSDGVLRTGGASRQYLPA